jgi:hypothetical protein
VRGFAAFAAVALCTAVPAFPQDMARPPRSRCPLFQGALVLAIGLAILVAAGAKAKSRGETFRIIAATLPVE